ncbi:MAG: prepilin-type N-terminal cleavage/methylation domain-containing protein [Deltaproteobacteria bacterium]|nr:prepilin-type N-terminal cleavage/methylation domain-containing protein [Deltaproteobacteria bacterium]
MNNLKKISGFTLIELIVVISIASLLLLFSFPMFKDINLFSNPVGQVGDIARLINDLKTRAVEQNVDFMLHLDSGSGMIWVTDSTMDDEERVTAKQKNVPLSEKITLLDVEFPGITETGSREHRIRFLKQGYSDFALIHIIADEQDITIKMEPFLARIQLIDGHLNFEDCF